MEEPKRKYTVTPKVLAASRANLVKANGVSKEIRYRPTPRRLLACHTKFTPTSIRVCDYYGLMQLQKTDMPG